MSDENVKDVPLYNPNDGLYGRGSNAGGYLDVKQAEEAEIVRAKIEGREPDLDNPGAYAGIQLQTAAQMIANRTLDVNRVSETGFARQGEDVFKQSVDDDNTLLKVADKIPAVAFDPEGLPGAPKPGEAVVNPTDPNADAESQASLFDAAEEEAATQKKATISGKSAK